MIAVEREEPLWKIVEVLAQELMNIGLTPTHVFAPRRMKPREFENLMIDSAAGVLKVVWHDGQHVHLWP